MNLYIQLENGVPVHHPILEENLLEAFPNIDLQNLPPTIAPFQKTPLPTLAVYEKLVYTSYEMVSGTVHEVHHTEFMTDLEKIEYQNKIQQAWQDRGGFASWTFDQTTAKFIPPVPKPQDGKSYAWDESTVSWLLTE